MGASINLVVDTFPDPVGRFGATGAARLVFHSLIKNYCINTAGTFLLENRVLFLDIKIFTKMFGTLKCFFDKKYLETK